MAKNKMYKSIVVRGRKKTKKKKNRKARANPLAGGMSPDKLLAVQEYEHKMQKVGRMT